MKFSQIKETCLYIHDLDKAEEFYHHKLGLPIIRREEGKYIFFRAGNSVLLCFISEASKVQTNLPPHYAEGNIHLAFECQSDEYEVWKEKIQNIGIEIIDETKWRNDLRSFYFNDPEGNVLEIVEPGIWDY